MNIPDHATSAIPAAAVQSESEKVLASSGFASSTKLSRSLRYVVDPTLEGQPPAVLEHRCSSGHSPGPSRRNLAF
ncbi:MAG: hypothetical protein M3Z32_13520 [Acidobacteriota bacterium]|nr:hypothetical protein [Acidobacteriota bacterium]